MADYWITLILGGILVLFGLAGTFWGKKEASEDYQMIADRADVTTDARDILEGWQNKSGSGALKTGGILTIIIGLFLLVLSAILLFNN